MRKKFKGLLLLAFLTLLATLAASQSGVANGKLQLHFMDVGQGDGAVLISPKGEIVMFDDGDSKECEKPRAYVEELGLKHVDYHIASHYHSDHIGCASEVLGQAPLTTAAYDRGEQYNTTIYDKYVKVVGNKRKTAVIGQKIVLDQNSGHPVTLTFVGLNGHVADNSVATENENDLSVVTLVEFDGFRAEFGGDLSGENTTSYQDIETMVGPKVGHIDVYKVHHHCSSHSTNQAWLRDTSPTIGIISTGNGNRYGHPAENCLENLHAANVTTYWTETGKGADPDPRSDTVVNGPILVEVAPQAQSFAVSYHGKQMATYPVTHPSASGEASPTVKYVWSKRSSVYHVASCPVSRQISRNNLVTSDTRPQDKQPHKCTQSEE